MCAGICSPVVCGSLPYLGLILCHLQLQYQCSINLYKYKKAYNLSKMSVPSLTSLLLGDISLGDAGVEALSVGLKESKSLATLDLSNPDSSSVKFGPKGAAALADCLRVNAVLTNLE